MKYKSLPLRYAVEYEGCTILFGSLRAALKYKLRTIKLAKKKEQENK